MIQGRSPFKRALKYLGCQYSIEIDCILGCCKLYFTEKFMACQCFPSTCHMTFSKMLYIPTATKELTERMRHLWPMMCHSLYNTPTLEYDFESLFITWAKVPFQLRFSLIISPRKLLFLLLFIAIDPKGYQEF